MSEFDDELEVKEPVSRKRAGSSESTGRAAALKKKKRKQVMMRRILFGVIIAALIAIIVVLCIMIFGNDGGSSSSSETEVVTDANGETKVVSSNQEILDEAALMYQQYDYEGAIAKLKTIEDYESDETVKGLIAEYEKAEATAVTVDVETVPHVFFHTLICDFERCFKSSHNQSLLNGYNSWMVTTGEFEECIQELYDAGYVIINVSDCYDKDANGNYTKATDIKLPSGKKALIVSYDDPCYYCQYQDWGMADKLIIDTDGSLRNEYTDESGNTTVGNYDHMPILMDFEKEHPDFCWHGHNGTLALTGYDGVLGYRTEFRMFEYPTGDETQWLEDNPWCKESEIETYKAQAKEVCDALKEQGYEFASHTWGHRHVDQQSLDWLETDTSWWLERVGCICGETDIFVYPHGGDVGGLENYTSDNEKYAYLKSVGFGCFCGVDGSALYWNQYTDNYVRQARIDIDGYLMYQTLIGNSNTLTQLGLDVEKIFDERRPTPVTTS